MQPHELMLDPAIQKVVGKHVANDGVTAIAHATGASRQGVLSYVAGCSKRPVTALVQSIALALWPQEIAAERKPAPAAPAVEAEPAPARPLRVRKASTP